MQRQPMRGQSRGRFPEPKYPDKLNYCFFHRTYGDRAWNCNIPCDFFKENPEAPQQGVTFRQLLPSQAQAVPQVLPTNVANAIYNNSNVPNYPENTPNYVVVQNPNNNHYYANVPSNSNNNNNRRSGNGQFIGN